MVDASLIHRSPEHALTAAQGQVSRSSVERRTPWARRPCAPLAMSPWQAATTVVPHPRFTCASGFTGPPWRSAIASRYKTIVL